MMLTVDVFVSGGATGEWDV